MTRPIGDIFDYAGYRLEVSREIEYGECTGCVFSFSNGPEICFCRHKDTTITGDCALGRIFTKLDKTIKVI